MSFLKLASGLRFLATGISAATFIVAACAPTPPPKPTEAPKSVATTAPAASAAASPAAGSVADRLRSVASDIDAALAAVGAGDLAKARQSFESFDQGWDRVEDDVKARSASAYTAIEDAMDDVNATLVKADNPDPGRAREALTKLKQTIDSNLPALG